ncbi:hypothetical protein M406DRAFT_287728 [Cryphonectria parasitica EP155]|uniref:Kelch repeat protein n=1 Tax=Cryphonectria parasitica (strain ATCC 38755 / EP155) TaxID=660469 RepID=A0A9P4Y5D3_CRYP1|nr:uncharacterized protein M406DRAFT_287728 [Cryphonectria parasitica EP155]KAF3766795.1 hypothetical protein M406DRAFT_287728 [Cryphonectria parasitica EP155]
MAVSRTLSLSLLAGLAPIVVAQLGGWVANEVNTTMCTWQGLRAAVIRDSVYMDGGYIYWRPGLADGSYGSAIQDHDQPGISLMLNFSIPFNISQNISALFEEPDRTSLKPLYYDGAMLASYDDYWLYGGLLTVTNKSAEPDSNTGLEWEQYPSEEGQTAFSPLFTTYELSGNMTRYIAYGGAASVPSESLGFYFAGLHGPTWDDIYYPDGDDADTATETSLTLITLDMAADYQGTWTNVTLPDDIPGRASPELVWVPVGKQGILVALGGVVYPEFVTADHVSENETASAWYTQKTTGGPGQLAQGCAVMQPAADYSSFNIYWYGGYDGLHATDDSYWNDAVWILSLPSFTWKQASTARSGYARAGHKCVMPYPDQMMVIGGQPAQASTVYDCVPDIIQIFNVSSAQWLDRYDPTVYSDYAVPSVIYNAIGGDGSGGATSTAPKSWDTSALGAVFQTAYATSKISTWYPYPESTSTSVTNPTYTPTTKSGGGSGVPKYLAPLLGVLLGLIFVSSVAVGIIVWRRRKLMKANGGMSVAPSDDKWKNIISWMNGQRVAEPKDETVTTSEELAHPSPTPEGPRFENNPQYPFMQNWREHPQQDMQQTTQPIHHEIDGTGILFELPGKPLPRPPFLFFFF